METPDEFKRFTRCFWQGSEREAADEKEWIANALKLNTTQQRAVIKRFLVALLSSDADAAELERVWNSGSPSYALVETDRYRYVFTLIRDMIKD